ncbi:hypothetical protein [Thalassovita aquimarina]|uniref:Uncharacterized protein n=1 Tax=Thalassovita aquimarina TaxID=2785917 RepID=A0ABS5HLZ2_9RHOB|nr:hypothetical protein [Thalassovita aquimarina]MBR9649623.1 hypothetical protein [Thalassovita aquimarina]
MSKHKGDLLRMMAKAETIKQAELARKLRQVQDETDRIAAQAGSLERLLDEHRIATPNSQTTAQLANTLRVGQQLESHRRSLSMQMKQSEHRLNRARTALAQSGHKLEILTDKARIADQQTENE